jgi:hypothetical protein
MRVRLEAREWICSSSSIFPELAGETGYGTYSKVQHSTVQSRSLESLGQESRLP